jgi:hypothetical protein
MLGCLGFCWRESFLDPPAVWGSGVRIPSAPQLIIALRSWRIAWSEGFNPHGAPEAWHRTLNWFDAADSRHDDYYWCRVTWR